MKITINTKRYNNGAISVEDLDYQECYEIYMFNIISDILIALDTYYSEYDFIPDNLYKLSQYMISRGDTIKEIREDFTGNKEDK